ncbi:ABC transporter substrate-binding protein [Haloferacaceae archaeon DSL9]
MSHDESANGVNRRTYLKFAGGAAATAALAGCVGEPGEEEDDGNQTGGDGDGEGDQPESGELRITQGTQPTTLDPQNHNDTPTYNVIDQAYEGLLSRSPDSEIVEQLATDYTRDSDSAIRFTIREDVAFHEGQDLQPSDVAYSINRTVQEDVGGIVSPQRDGLGGVAGAEVDGGDVVVDLSSVNPAAFDNFASFCRIVSEEWTEERDGEIGTEMNGTGPFQLEEFEEDVYVHFTAYDDYWGETSNVEEVRINAATESSTRVNSLINGETDIIVDVPPTEVTRVDDSDAAAVSQVQSTRVIFLVMTYDQEPFDSLEFRRAMNYAVDVESIINSVLDGFGAVTSQPTLEGHNGHNPDVEPYGYDPDTAQQLVEESGYSGVEIELVTPQGRYLNDSDIAQAAAQQINELPNVSCSSTIEDFGSLTERALDGDTSSSPAFWLIGWGNPTFDANYTLIPWFYPGQASTHYESEEITSLLDQSENETDDAAREELLQQINAQLNEEAPWVFLHNQYSIYGVSERIDWEPRPDEDILATEVSL